MPPADVLHDEVAAFFESYRTAFERGDAALIAEHYAYPAHITSDIGHVALVLVSSKDDWTNKANDLLGMYARIGFHSATVLEIAVVELSTLVVQGRVKWALNDAAGQLLYDFDAIYTLGRFEDGLKITAICNNEMPRYRACFARLGAA
jgi:hypothetical protein